MMMFFLGIMAGFLLAFVAGIVLMIGGYGE